MCKNLIIAVAIAATIITVPAVAHIPAQCDDHRDKVLALVTARDAAWETWRDAVLRDGGLTIENFNPLIEAYDRMSKANLQWLRCIDGQTVSPLEEER